MIRWLRRTGALVDAGFSSLSTFLTGIVALQVLESAEMAFYSIVFAAALTSATVPQQLALTPRRIDLTSHPSGTRTSLRADALRTVPYFAVSSAILAILALSNFSLVGVPTALAMTASGVAVLVATVVNNHVRGVAHAIGRHERAGLGAAVQFGVGAAGASILVPASRFLEIPGWIPLTLLATAALIGATTTWAGSRRLPVVELDERFRRRERFSLLGNDAATQAAAYVAATAVAHVLGTQAANTQEAMRLGAQPVLVISLAVVSFWGPRATRAAFAGNRRDEVRAVTGMLGLVAGAAALYAAALPAVLPLLEWATGQDIPFALTLGLIAALALGRAAASLQGQFFARRTSYRYFAYAFVAAALQVTVLLTSISSVGLTAVPLSIATANAVLLTIAVVDLGRQIGRKQRA